MVLKSSMYFPAYGRARTGEINLRILNIHIRIPSAGIVHCTWEAGGLNVLLHLPNTKAFVFFAEQ